MPSLRFAVKATTLSEKSKQNIDWVASVGFSLICSQKYGRLEQARSQDLEKGGAILKEWEVCKRPWLEFSLALNHFQMVCPKFETKCLGKIGNSKVFSAQNQVISKKKKKKKGLRQNSEWFFDRNPKFKRFLRPKSGDLQKKKGLRQNSRRFFSQFRNFKRLRGGYFRMGGAIFHFSQKIGLKSTKNMRFCILHKPMGGARAPPAPPPWLRYWARSRLVVTFHWQTDGPANSSHASAYYSENER